MSSAIECPLELELIIPDRQGVNFSRSKTSGRKIKSFVLKTKGRSPLKAEDLIKDVKIFQCIETRNKQT